MEYIVDPKWIYVIETLSSIHFVLLLYILITAVGCLGNMIIYFYTASEQISFENWASLKSEWSVLKDTTNRLKSNIEVLFRTSQSAVEKQEITKDNFQIVHNNFIRICENIDYIKKEVDGSGQRILGVHKSLANSQKWIMFFGKLCLIGLVAQILIPSTETGYKMLIAHMATPDNLHFTIDSSKEYIDWAIHSIVNAIKEVK